MKLTGCSDTSERPASVRDDIELRPDFTRPVDLSDLCAVLNLTVSVGERARAVWWSDSTTRYYAELKDASDRFHIDQLLDADHVSMSVYGNGSTGESAVRNLAETLSDRVLQFDPADDAYGSPFRIVIPKISADTFIKQLKDRLENK